ncbi:MAG: dihydrolipoyl dehydrogenase [Desulfovibrio sp.]|jgi:dihydrolipoamide dehydrogenase|nr:dihydrolipoyl dehydrogenase [Desulfovibrio sp.]
MAAYDYDITVIGGGPGGYVAALKAAAEGKRVCLVEKGRLGGVCLNEGCIPTKTLIRTANLLHEIKRAGDFALEGMNGEAVSVSMSGLRERKAQVVRRLVNGVKGLLRGRGVTLVEGAASFVDAHSIEAGGRKITSEYIIIATGSRALIPSFIKFEGENRLLTSREALDLDALPASVAVIGGGVIGMEFAYLFNKLGSKVTVLELMEHILPMVDEEVSGLARKRLEKDGVVVHSGAKVRLVQDNSVFFEKGGVEMSVAAECVLLAVGRTPDTEGLKAAEIGIAFDRAAILTDDSLRTNLPHIFAVGDVNGRSMLAHTASHEGIVAVETICGKTERMDYGKIPSCVYLEPEIACIGLTEKQAREQRKNVKVGRFPMAANGKSLVEGDTEGLVKVIVEGELGEILGVHIYAGRATDLIAEIALALTLEATAEEIIRTVHPHPTISEVVPEAFMAAFGKAVHCL